MPENLYPGQIVDFNVYRVTTTTEGTDEFSTLLGHGNEVTLPTVTSKTYTADLPAGEMDLPGMRTENMEIEIPFNVFDDETAGLISLTETTTLELRSASQSLNTEDGDFEYKGLKVRVKGFAKEVSIGTLKRSDGMDSKIKMTISYLQIDGTEAGSSTYSKNYITIDKVNETYKVNGKNVREGIDKFYP